MSNVIPIFKNKDAELYINHVDGTVKGSPHFKRPGDGDFTDRINRIRASLEKINTLMAELKRQKKETT